MHNAMIVGSNGQDGRLLFERLESEGCTLLGIAPSDIRHTLPNGDVFDCPIDILNRVAVDHAIRTFPPDSIFYLAGYHHASEDEFQLDQAALYLRSHDIHVGGLLNVLESARRHAPRARIFYAASSHCFGEPPTDLQDEATPLSPRGPYGISKTAGVQLCRMYRARHALRASCGFLYNHESPLRTSNFISMKIVRAAVEIYHGQRNKLTVGDLSARTDWGYAPDYVDAMVRILQRDAADDFIIATGQSHSVEDFVSIAFSHLKIDWRQYVQVNPSLITKSKPLRTLIGDSTKLRALTGWSPSVTFQEMVQLLVDAEVQRASRDRRQLAD
jgi:GDPmannose 4,6-dehydratase